VSALRKHERHILDFNLTIAFGLISRREPTRLDPMETNSAMTTVYSRKMKMPYGRALTKVTEVLANRGFGIITTIDLKSVFKNKLNVDFRNYIILGACNPDFAYKAVSMESHIGVMLPCNIVVQQHENGEVEISAINPMDSIARVHASPALNELATEVGTRLRAALDDLQKEFHEVIETEALPETNLDSGTNQRDQNVNPALELT
jgi:uncharacterized protein (DUF302 family)